MWPRVVTILLVASLSARPLRAETPSHLEQARVALASLGYTEAATLLERALVEGGLSRTELLEVYALRGEVAAVIDGAQASEREFRNLLVLDPAHAPPARESPTFTVPFESARAWVTATGALRVESVAVARDRLTFATNLRIVADPLAMVAGARIRYRSSDAQPYQQAASPKLEQLVTSPPETSSYYVEVLDRWGNTLLVLGAPEAPLRVDALSQQDARVVPTPSPTPTSRRTLTRALLGVGAATAIAGGVMFGLSSRAVDRADGAMTRDAYLDASDDARTYDLVGGVMLGVGGALAITGAVLAVRDARRGSTRRSAWITPTGSGAAIAGEF